MLDTRSRVRPLPVFPLPMVAFPSQPIPLHIFEPRYKTMMADVLSEDGCFGIQWIDSQSGTLAVTGCMVQVLNATPLSDGRMNIETIGRKKYQMLSVLDESPYLRAEVRFEEEEEEINHESNLMALKVKAALSDVLRLSNKLYAEKISTKDLLPDDPIELSYFVPATLYASAFDQQKVLEMATVLDRLKSEFELFDTARKYLAARAALKDAFEA